MICGLFILSTYIVCLNMKSFLFLLSGIFAGLYLSWPGIVISKNWKCFNNIILKASDNKISIKAVLEISPSYLVKRKNNNMYSKARIIADACFR